MMSMNIPKFLAL